MAFSDGAAPDQWENFGDTFAALFCYLDSKSSREKCAMAATTLKRALAGKPISRQTFNGAVRSLFSKKPLAWIELKVRFAEACLGRKIGLGSNEKDEKKLREAWTPSHIDSLSQINIVPKSDRYFRNRLAGFLNRHIPRTDKLRELANPVGDKSHRGYQRVGYSTITQLLGGTGNRLLLSRRFQEICERVLTEREDKLVAGIMYVEVIVGEYLLGSDPQVFHNPQWNIDQFPRSAALIHYTVQRKADLGYDREIDLKTYRGRRFRHRPGERWQILHEDTLLKEWYPYGLAD